MTDADAARRRFLLGTGGALAGAWVATSWPAIATAHEHAARVAQTPGPARFEFLTAAQAADVDAVAAHILPSGETPGAREAHVVYFIDRALATLFTERAPLFREGLTQFQHAFSKACPSAPSFAEASPVLQLAFLHTVDTTPFFAAVRQLTVMGTLAASQYGGNFEGMGWKLIGFEDMHVFTAPFGHYDRDYAGFVPYTEERKG
jgi:gluconate 2-dehydrogenase gamma chain